jgi:hypothetical protein
MTMIQSATIKVTSCRRKIRDWLLHNQVPTVQGNFKVDANGLNIGLHQYMIQVRDETPKLIWPVDAAQTHPLVPYTGS